MEEGKYVTEKHRWKEEDERTVQDSVRKSLQLLAEDDDDDVEDVRSRACLPIVGRRSVGRRSDR